VGYMLLDADGVIGDVNRSGAALLDWPRERLIAGHFCRWVVRDDRDLFARHLRELQEGDGRHSEELRVRTRSGWPLHVRLDSLRIAAGDGALSYRTAMIDVSAHRCAERQARLLQSRLMQAARLSTIGALASCLAHDLNQPLGTIVLNCDAALRMLRTHSGDDDGVAQALSQASAAAAYAGEITRHLRSFLRNEGAPPVAVQVPGLIADAMKLMEAEARDHDVRLEAECLQGLPAVLVEPVHIEQVLINLIANGIEAIRGADGAVRRITIRAQPLPSRRVQISVEDTGPGMNRKCAARAFQPFYTTKRDGMGMGLSISHAIIEAHGGKLWAEPAPEIGAVLHFTLPATDDATPCPPSRPSS
jgi:two-component system sensor kinase FixL